MSGEMDHTPPCRQSARSSRELRGVRVCCCCCPLWGMAIAQHMQRMSLLRRVCRY